MMPVNAQLFLLKPARSRSVRNTRPIGPTATPKPAGTPASVQFGASSASKRLAWGTALVAALGLSNAVTYNVGEGMGRRHQTQEAVSKALESAALKDVNNTMHWCKSDGHTAPGVHHVEAGMTVPGYFDHKVVADLHWKLVDEKKLPPNLFDDLKNPPFVATPADAAETLVNKILPQHMAGLLREEWYKFDPEDPKAFADRMQRILTDGYDKEEKPRLYSDAVTSNVPQEDKNRLFLDYTGSPTFKNTDIFSLQNRLRNYGIDVVSVTVSAQKQVPLPLGGRE